jgi:hypothetical protein
MRRNRIVVERAHVTDVHMRIDQTRNEKATVTIDLFRVRAGDKVGSNLCDSSVGNHNRCMGERSRALRRNDRHVADHGCVVHNLRHVGIHTGEKTKNESRRQIKPNDRPPSHLIIDAPARLFGCKFCIGWIS